MKSSSSSNQEKGNCKWQRETCKWKRHFNETRVHDYFMEMEKMRKKRKITERKKHKTGLSEVYIDGSETGQNDQLVGVECIEVQ